MEKLLRHKDSGRHSAAAGGGPLRRAWHRIRAAAAEMNYAARRAVEVQAHRIAEGR
jgi:hypothetical protein